MQEKTKKNVRNKKEILTCYYKYITNKSVKNFSKLIARFKKFTEIYFYKYDLQNIVKNFFTSHNIHLFKYD